MRKFSLVLFLSVSASLAQTTSFTNGQAARAVIGQGTFTDGTVQPVVNNIQTAAPAILGGAGGVAYYNGTVYIADDNALGAVPENNRVLGVDVTVIPPIHADPTNYPHPSPRCWLCGYGAYDLVGQVDYTTTLLGRSALPTTTAGSLNQPTAVATDGHYFAIADSNNNRVLLWNAIPQNQNTPPDIVLGQADFTSFQTPQLVNANSLRGPQGLWFQSGKLYVADTQNNRVLAWNTIPTRNNQPADFVLGQPNFTTSYHPTTIPSPASNGSQLLSPVSVTSDGTHLFVTDLGFNRVLIWNTLPTSNGQSADVAVGQPDLSASLPNYVQALCPSNGTDTAGNATFPARCEKTLNFPRFALAGGGKLYIADAGNDRILIYNSIPAVSGASADLVLGQPDFVNDTVTNVSQSFASTAVDNTSSVETVQSPSSLAFDGTNLYVADPFNRRVLQFSPADIPLPGNSVVNWASEIIRQEGVVVLTGTALATNDTVTVTIAGTAYTYTLVKGDTLDLVAQGLVALINANTGDPYVTAIFTGAGTGTLYLSSKASNLPFDTISLAATTSNAADIAATASGAYLTAGTAATGAPGMLVEINAQAGTTFTDQTLTSPMPQTIDGALPKNLGGVEVIVDGIPAPILSVSPSQIVIQLSYALFDRSSVSISVISNLSNGTVTATTATPVYIALANPGLFNAPQYPGQPRPWPALGALHQLGNPNVVVDISGTITANDVATITIAGKAYSYTVVTADTLATITQNLINVINAAPDPNVTASVGPAFNRVVLTAQQPGAAGTGITVAGSTNTSASITVTAYNSATCCTVPQGQPISPASPAVPGETITLLASGLGALADPAAQAGANLGGTAFIGKTPNTAGIPVNASINGATAQIVSAGLPTFSYGTYYVQVVVPTSLSANAAAQVYIAQNAFISNTVTIPVSNAGAVITGPSAPGAGIAGAGSVVVSPANLVFANQVSPPITFGSQTVTIQDTGTTVLNISSISVTGANGPEFSVNNNCPPTLQPSTFCQVTVGFTPGGTGIRSASLVVNTSASSSPQTVPLSGVSATGLELINGQTGKALEVAGGSTADGATIQQWEITSNGNQRWALVPVGSDTYAIMNVTTGKVLDVPGGSATDATPIQQYTYYGYANQLWTLTAAGNGYSTIVNVATGKALDLADASYNNGAVIQEYTPNGTPGQTWKFTTFQSFEIKSVLSGSVLDVTGASTANGTPIQEYQAFGYPQQQWYLIPVDNTYFRILNVLTLKCLDVTGASAANGTPIEQYDFFGFPQQLWALVPAGNGNFAIINKLSGRALDITGASSANGTPIQQYDYFAFAQQQWTLVPMGFPGL